MARAVLENLLDAKRLDELFERTAQKQYHRTLLFSAVTDLLCDVTRKLQPSVFAAYQARKGDWGVSPAALYDKLNGVETCVSAEMVRDSSRQAGAVIDALAARLDPWVPGYRSLVLDGNPLSATEHRIGELRTLWDAPLPGKALVVLDQERMLACDLFLTEEGHARERSLLDAVLATVSPGDLWIADRNFCTLEFLLSIDRCSAYFLIRQHKGLPGELVGKRR